MFAFFGRTHSRFSSSSSLSARSSSIVKLRDATMSDCSTGGCAIVPTISLWTSLGETVEESCENGEGGGSDLSPAKTSEGKVELSDF